MKKQIDCIQDNSSNWTADLTTPFDFFSRFIFTGSREELEKLFDECRELGKLMGETTKKKGMRLNPITKGAFGLLLAATAYEECMRADEKRFKECISDAADMKMADAIAKLAMSADMEKTLKDLGTDFKSTA